MPRSEIEAEEIMTAVSTPPLPIRVSTPATANLLAPSKVTVSTFEGCPMTDSTALMAI